MPDWSFSIHFEKPVVFEIKGFFQYPGTYSSFFDTRNQLPTQLWLLVGRFQVLGFEI